MLVTVSLSIAHKDCQNFAQSYYTLYETNQLISLDFQAGQFLICTSRNPFYKIFFRLALYTLAFIYIYVREATVIPHHDATNGFSETTRHVGNVLCTL